MATDYYALLGVGREASADEIKRAYRKLARELHPDVNPEPSSQEKFKEVTAAYEVLSDPEKRQMYDLGGDPFSRGGGAGAGGFGFDFGDIMDAFFSGGQQRGPRTRVRRGQDALIRINIDLGEAVFGAPRELAVDTAVVCGKCDGEGTAEHTHAETCPMCRGKGEIQSVQKSFLGQIMTSRVCPQCSGFGTVIAHPCPECSGDGRVRTRKNLTIKIPAGVDTGTRIQLAGQGEIGPNGGPAGDLYVEVAVNRHEIYERSGDDLHCRINVPMTSAALGTAVTLETFDGEHAVDVRAGTQSGQEYVLRGLGVTHLRGSGRGDLHVHVEVATPTKLDAQQEALLRELAQLRAEEQVEVRATVQAKSGLFSKMKDAFK